MRSIPMSPRKALLFCDDCGKGGDDVFETFCPYAQDIHATDEACVLCSHCEHERAMEI